MKKSLLVLLSLMLAASCTLMLACNPKDKGKTLKPAADSFSYYPDLPAAEDKHLTVINGTLLNDNTLATVSCLQGLVARTSSEIYIVKDNDQGATSNYKLWLDDLVENYGYTFEYVNSVKDLILKYNSHVTDLGIVVYSAAMDSGDDGLNVATTICSAEGYLPVEESLLSVAQSEWGLGEVKVDTTNTTDDGDYRDEKWSFDEYKDKLSKSILIHQDPQKSNMRDYAVAANAFCFFYDRIDDIRFITEVYQWAEKDIPIMGWCEDELAYVALNSGFSKITIGTDWSVNLTTLSAVQMSAPIKQNKYTAETVAPESGKHYLAMVMSDGDNIQWMQSNFINHTDYFGSPFRGDFKLTWGANPSSADLIPSVLRKVYDSATAKDEFITGVSGNGYINPTDYASLDDYVSRTSAYMKRADLKYVDLLDGGTEKDALRPYGQMPNIGGGVWKVGNKYVEGGGAVYWSNGKPFITFRESMWTETSQSMLALANRINHYQTDPNRIEGYTVLNIHPWSHSMTDVKKFVGMLDEHVEIITAGELIEMVKENVPHNDVEKLEKPTIPDVEYPDYVLPGVTLSDLDLINVQTENTFNTSSIFTNFSRSGKIDVHTEGVCLEVQTGGNDFQSFIYAKFNITADNDRLVVAARRFVRPGEIDSQLGVKVVGADGKANTIRAEGASSDWVTIDTDSYKLPEYDLSAYRGQTVTVAIGSRRGEHTAINEIKLVKSSDIYVLPGVTLDDLNALSASADYSFSHTSALKNILPAWKTSATGEAQVAQLGEGVDLQFAGQNADADAPITVAIYNRFTIDEAHSKLTVSARTFIGQNGPVGGQEPQYIPMLHVRVIKADGTVFNFPLVAIDTDTYKIAEFDLSGFIGETVGIALGTGRGYHCAINAIDFVRTADLLVLPGVTIEQLNALPASDKYNFAHNSVTQDILPAWKTSATGEAQVAQLGEGVDLQFAGQNADADAPITVAIYNRFTIDEAHSKLTVSARTFIGQNGPVGGQDPQYIPMLHVRVIKADGTVFNFPLVAIDTDTYKIAEFDLSGFIGETVGIALGTGRGYHCAINNITLD